MSWQTRTMTPLERVSPTSTLITDVEQCIFKLYQSNGWDQAHMFREMSGCAKTTEYMYIILPATRDAVFANFLNFDVL